MTMDRMLTPVAPVPTPAPYVGGKRLLAKRLAARIAGIPHRTYVEPFVGMGGVFLRRSLRPECEVMNDANGDVACLFRILQRHFEAFCDMLKWQLTSREHFERLKSTPAESLTDLERAARFIYLQRISFGGKVGSRSFGTNHRVARFDVPRLVPILEQIHSRLAGVWIEHLDFEPLIRKWDHPDTLFYLDPPYWACEHYYVASLFSPADHERLAACLRDVKGTWIMSMNDVPEIRALYPDACIETTDLTYSVGSDAPKSVSEIIITNC